MKRFMKTLGCALIALSAVFTSKAQSPHLDSAKNELYRINKVFDSSGYLAFDVAVLYNTDTLFGSFEHQEVYGNYIINRNNLYSKLDKTEFIQTDSFTYNIYNGEKTLMMTKNTTSNSSLFPIRDFVDSVMTWYDTAYTITLRTEDSVLKVIEFSATNPSLPFTHFAVYYDAGTYYPVKFQMNSVGEFDLSQIPDSILSNVAIKPMQRRVTMEFSNYRSADNLDVFKDINYAIYDRAKRAYRLTSKYRGYRFFANGVNADQVEEPIELTGPPSNAGGSPY